MSTSGQRISSHWMREAGTRGWVLRHLCLAAILGGAAMADAAEGHAGAEVSYNRDIRPLLSSRCFSCHGPDAQSRQAELRLDQPDGDQGAYASAIVPGAPEDSEVWNRVTTDDASLRMPPEDSHLQPLTREEQSLLRQWIRDGAKYEQHWAFRKPETPAEPQIRNTAWSDQTLDHFVLQRLETDGLSPTAAADARTLIRRVTLDLTGLPPTREEISGFIDHYKDSPDTAWETLVDDLLTRPSYGEHRARFWLDVVRFADTNGMHKDFYRNNVAYRDWVIRAFNDNVPYDDFLRYQLAGDLYPSPSRDQLVASGFHRLHLIIDRGTALPEESHVKNVLDRVAAVGTAFLGLTIQCAQCHDHKFDPVSQREFYSLYAFLNNLDAEPETNPRQIVDGLQQPFVRWPTAEQSAALEGLQNRLKIAETELKAVTAEIAGLPESADPELLEDKKTALENQIKRVKQERTEVERGVDKAMVMRERAEVRETHILVRGQYDAPSDLVQRGTPAFLPPLNPQGPVPTRMDLAEWLVSPDHPLTARVAVNRVWQSFFGVGLVKTSEDFGNQGSVPSHPALLDQLTVDFVRSGWDIKALVKRIVMSHTYRQSSQASSEQYQTDPENRLLARGPRYRLDAEVIRDQILATSGLLNREFSGRSVKPPQPDGLWRAVSMTGERFRPDSGDAVFRRSVYTFWKRAMPPPQMTILNAPIRDACIARRERTNTPSQALLLLNEPEYLKAARHLAEQALQQPAQLRLEFVWETITGGIPDGDERVILTSLLADLRRRYTGNPALAAELCGATSIDTPGQRVELASWTVLCNTIYNLDITKNKN